MRFDGGSSTRDDDLTPVERQRLKAAFRRRRWMLVLAAATVPLAGLTGILVARAQHPGQPMKHPWLILPLVGFPIVLAVALYPLLRRQYRRPGVMRRLVVSGNRDDLRQVGRALRRGTPIPGEDRVIAAALLASYRRLAWFAAALLASYRRLAWFAAALVVLGLSGLALAFGESGSSRIFRFVSSALYLAVAASLIWTMRRYRATAAAQGITDKPDDG